MPNRFAVHAVTARHLEAAPERVYDAWLNRTMLGQWMFGPFVREGEEIVHLALDPHVGGAFSFLVERDGEDVAHVGKFLELQRPRRLVFTWTVAGEPLGSRLIVEIERAGEETSIRVDQEMHPAWGERVAALTEEWEGRLEALAVALAANHPAARPRLAEG